MNQVTSQLTDYPRVLPAAAAQVVPARRLQIAIVRALPGLGDMLCAVPAWRALRAGYPDARITLIGLPETRALAARFGTYIDSFMEFPGYPGMKERTPEMPELLEFLHGVQGQFDIALQMHGSGVITNHFTVLLGAKQTAGFYLPDQFCPNRQNFLLYPDYEPEIWRNLRLVSHLGVPLHGDDLEFPIFDWDREEFERLPEAQPLWPDRYIVIHAGASDAHRCWPVDRFAAVADELAARGYQIVLTGSAAEKPLARDLAARMAHPVIDLAGQTSIGALAVLLQQARLVVCNDTGVSHLAAALRAPSVVVFQHTEVVRWAPLNRTLHRVVSSPPRATGHGIEAIPVEAVLSEVEAHLREGIRHAA